MKNFICAVPRVLVLAGNERQESAARSLSGTHRSPGGQDFDLLWIPPGFVPSHRSLETIQLAIAKSTILLVSPRMGKIQRRTALETARSHGVVVVQLTGSGTGASGVKRSAGDAVDRHLDEVLAAS